MGASSSKVVLAGIITNLLQNDSLSTTDYDFWDELWKTNISIEDVFEVISADDVSMLIKQRPANVKTLITQAIAQLYQVVETPFPIYFDQALNCLKMLSRFLPLLITTAATGGAAGTEISNNIHSFLWSCNPSNKGINSSSSGSDVSGNNSNSGDNNNSSNSTSDPLAVVLINALFHLLFLPDFTIDDPNQDFQEKDIHTQKFRSALMWGHGVGSNEKSVTVSTAYDKSRCEVIRVLLALLATDLLQFPDSYSSVKNKYMEVATSSDIPYGEIVFYSLINTVLGYDPIGWGLPLGNVLSTDTSLNLVEISVQLLLVLLDYGYPCIDTNTASDSGADNNTGDVLPTVAVTNITSEGFNIYRKILRNIVDPDQLYFIYRGISRLLTYIVTYSHTSSSLYSSINIEQELLVLLWKLLEENVRFMSYLLKSTDVTELLLPMFAIMLSARNDSGRAGVVYLCTFLLLKLSGQRNFAVALNALYTNKEIVLSDVPFFQGTFADLLVITLHKLIVTGDRHLASLHNCYLTIVCNVSPYIKSFNNIASIKLVNLFQLFYSSRFLYSSSNNCTYVALLLETFSNIVQYQYEGNANLVYCLVRSKTRALFLDLSSLTLQEAASRGRYVREKKNKKSSSSSSSSSSSGSSSGNSNSDEGSEIKHDDVATTTIITTTVAEVVGSVGAPATTASATGGTSTSSRSTASTNGFVPDSEWLSLVKAEVPLATLGRLIKYLAPQIDELTQQEGSDEGTAIEYIRSSTMVGLLPIPHPIVIRKYQPNRYTSLWFSAYLCGIIYMHNQEIPLYENVKVNLFLIEST